MSLDVNLIVFFATVIAFPLCLAGMLWLTLIYRHRRNKQLHATIMYFADKGLTIPPELLSPPTPRLHRALTVTGLGIGLIAYLRITQNAHWSIGLLPLSIGLAQLLAWKLDSRARSSDR